MKLPDAQIWPYQSSGADSLPAENRLSWPYVGGKHQFMVRDALRLRIPNPHRSDIGKNLLRLILKEAGVTIEEWECL